MPKVTLEINQELKGRKTYKILKLLNGDGGQGGIYLAKDDKRQTCVVKWYWENDAEQSNHIRRMVQDGIPAQLRNLTDVKFLWPLDYLSDGTSFGYVMEAVDTTSRYNYEKIVWHNDPKLGKKVDYAMLCTISKNILTGFNALHSAGYCYMDMSRDNITFDDKGSIIVFDPDNIVVNDPAVLDPARNKALVAGTSGFIAPEILNKISNPNTKTDLWQISIFLFYLWIKHHPLDGELLFEDDKYNDINLLCKDPKFIFDKSTKNYVGDDWGEFGYANKWWGLAPEPMKQMFLRAFTLGCSPNNRIREAEWNRTIVDVENNHLISCPKCGKKTNKAVEVCAYCGEKIPKKPIVKMVTEYYIAVYEDGTRTKRIQISDNDKYDGTDLSSYLSSGLFAQVTHHPKNPSILGLQNMTNVAWEVHKEDKTTITINPNKNMIIKDGNKFTVKTSKGNVGIKVYKNKKI